MREELLKFVQAEAEAKEKEVRDMHRRTVYSRVKSGRCLTGLNFKKVDDEGFFIYSYKNNESKFRAGDSLVINERRLQGDAVSESGVLVYMEDIDHSRRWIKLDKALVIDPPRANNCILDESYYDFTSEILKQSIELAYEMDEVVTFLEGRAQLFAADQARDAEVERHRRDYSGLTLRQSQALVNSMVSPATLIQGPPGSGKTFLLALIIERAIAQGKSILVTAPTHKAIDNLLAAVAGRLQAEAAPIIKIKGRGKPPKLPREVLQTTTNDRMLTEFAEQDAPFIIGSTVYQAFKLQRSGMPPFDLVVIDEAGQMPIVQAMPALINGARYVIAGDHRQLAPIIKAKGVHPDYLKRSVFEHLHEQYVHATITLDVTFRMNEQINEFPSKAFYENVLRPSDCAAKRCFVPAQSVGSELDYVVHNNGAVTFLELEHKDASNLSTQEADLVASLACDLLSRHRVEPQELAIVSPYRKHNTAIRQSLHARIEANHLVPANTWDHLVVDTVDRLQGQEREVIIFSLCTSNRDCAINKAQFLYSPNRMNVAITRSRTRLFLVGSKFFFPHLNGILIDAHDLKLWTNYYEYLVGNGYRVVHRNGNA